jgi:hypothetical protein
VLIASSVDLLDKHVQRSHMGVADSFHLVGDDIGEAVRFGLTETRIAHHGDSMAQGSVEVQHC